MDPNQCNKFYLDFDWVAYEHAKALPFIDPSRDIKTLREQQDRIREMEQRLARLAGVRNADRIHPHTLRHTFAINWVQHGGDIESLRRILGHNDLSTTQVYLNFDFEHLRNEYRRLFENKRQFGTI